MSHAKRFLNPKELSEFLGISVNTVYSWIWLNKIPYVKCGRLIKFDMKDIENWIKHNKVPEGITSF